MFKFLFVFLISFSFNVFAKDKDFCLYSETVRLNNDAADYQYKYQNSMNSKRFSKLMQMREDIFNLSKKINVNELSEYHDNLPYHYEIFMAGQELQIKGWKQSNSELIYKGQVKLNEFGMWFNKNRKSIKYPKVKKNYCKKIIK